MKMHIRAYEREDYDVLMEMVSEFYVSEAVCTPELDKKIDDTIQAVMSFSPYVDLYIIEYDHKIAGYMVLCYTWSMEVDGLCVIVDELFIKEDFRGQRIGSHIFTWIDENCTKAKRIRLEVSSANNRAGKLYEKLGFEVLEYVQMVK